MICANGIDIATPVLWVALVMGLLIGSFLTVVIDRVPRGASVVQPGSACGSCGLELGPLDLVYMKLFCCQVLLFVCFVHVSNS